MDWKQVLSLSNEEVSDEQKENIFMELIKDQKVESKIAKKLFPICITILKYKGQQVDKQREEIAMLASSDIDLKATLDEMEKQKKAISKYDSERAQYKARIKELQEEIALTQSRELKGSDDEDSPDQLSEIDRAQELMGTISKKNKHINGLLNEIKINEEKCSNHINAIKSLKIELDNKEEDISKLHSSYEETAGTVLLQEEKIAQLNRRLQEQIVENQQVAVSNQQQQLKFEAFSQQLDARVQLYREKMDEKDRELRDLKDKYENLVERVPGIDVDSENSEMKRLSDLIKERDDVIRELEDQIRLLSTNLVDSTELIDKIGRDKEKSLKNESLYKSGQCCKELRERLERCNKRCEELQVMMECAEDDSKLRTQHAYEAVQALRSYETSTDGLCDALKKIHKLQADVHQRDKQIREFVIELNAQNEIVAENAVLRRRLGIPDEEIIETKGYLARQKRFSKVNDRLALQLRASEEMRLQLKLEKNDMKRKINELQAQLNAEAVTAESNAETTSSVTSENLQNSKIKNEFKECENCHATYNVYESIKFCRNCIMKHQSNLCGNCIAQAKITASENAELIKKISKAEIEHQSIADENEKLRDGLMNILQKLEKSEQNIINSVTVKRLHLILDVKSNNRKVTQSNLEVDEGISLENSEVLRLSLQNKDLLEENETLRANLEQMDVLRAHYDELVRTSELSDDDKHKLLMKSVERCQKFETNLKVYERKIEFLLAENDHLHAELRALKITSVELKNDVRMGMIEKPQQESVELDRYDSEEKSNILDELRQVRSELNGLCLCVLKNIKSLDEDNILNMDTDKFSQIAILDTNQATNIITRQELNALTTNQEKLQETIRAHEAREKHFEELARVAQYQLKSQQLMLSQFSDDEIIARHLIVDLQSNSNESYLLTKTVRDLKTSRESEDRLRLENEKLKAEISSLEETLRTSKTQVDAQYKNLSERESNNKLKIQYLRKTLVDMCNQYSSMTPIYLISDFIKHYATLLEARKNFDVKTLQTRSKSLPEISLSEAQLKEISMASDIEVKIEIIKQKSSCDYLKQQLEMSAVSLKELHNEIARIKLNEVRNMQHWNTIQMLFGSDGNKATQKELVVQFDKEIQVEPLRNDCGTITDEIESASSPKKSSSTPPSTRMEKMQKSKEPTSTSSENTVVPIDTDSDGDRKSLRVQLKKALILASSRSALLIETENCLSEAHGRIKVLEKNLENQQKQIKTEQKSQRHQSDESNARKDDHIHSMTISTLQGLILEKDTTLSRYQELLKSERQHNMRTFDSSSDEIKQLKKVIDALEDSITQKEKIIEKLKKQIEELKDEGEEKISIAIASRTPPPPSIQQQRVAFTEHDIERRSIEFKLKEAQSDMKSMEQQIKDLIITERQLQATIRERDGSIKELNMKLKTSHNTFETLNENFASTTEIDQLRDMLEDKDKHIQDLTETLNQLNDDQQRYINDTALNSVEQVHIISTDLARAEATNRVLATQLEALKRQLTNVQQREKQSREMIKTLKNQLIRRPVFSVTSDKRPTTSSREEQLQKKTNELENELRETKDELRRQTNINDNKKAKNAAELGLWEKQKRYQEMAERLKTKLTEKEIDFERLKASLQIAKNTITRLEKEKMLLENKVKSGRYLQSVSNSNQQSACQHCNQQKHHLETTSFIDATSEINHDLINALKMRIEAQQRRIVAMELDGKGSNVFATEVEKLQEESSAIHARNIRLEAKNIQLQLDLDLMRQNDNGQRQDARIKHLEDYILALKDELSQSHTKVDSPEHKHKNHHDSSVAHIQALEQTILKLKRVIEKLQVENKYLKGSSSRHCSSATVTTSTYMSQNDRKKEEIFEKLKIEHEKLQKVHAEAISKNSALKIELELLQAQSAINVSCPHCSSKNLDDFATQDIDVIRQQLQQKTALLEKAKIILQRAAGKEKHLIEKINYYKKRVLEFEGVAIISEENSDSN